MDKLKIIGLLLFFFGHFLWVQSQTNVVQIQKITIEGNKRTKEKTILRELDFIVGDTFAIENIGSRVEQNRLFLMNTGLFGQVKINLKNWDTKEGWADILVEVEEFWFIYPLPIFELSDRNFNEWWQTYNRDLGRINLGVRFYHTNLTGRKDLLKVLTQFGFTNKYEIEYTLPSINKKQNLGIYTNTLWTRNKEIAYNTFNDTLQFFRNPDEVLLRRFRAGMGLRFRPKVNHFFSGVLNFHRYAIAESVRTNLNSEFFSSGTLQRYLSLKIEMNIDKRDIRPFPLMGYQVRLSIQKSGFGIFDDFNAGHTQLTLKKYFSFSKKLSLELVGKGQLGIIRKRQPYYQYIGLGYLEDYIRGYELYVIDGLDYAYTKTSLRFEIFNQTFQWGKIMPIKQFRRMPVRWYLSINNDLGFVNDPFRQANNGLRNELLWGVGVGLNIVVFYDKVFQVEYSRNRLGESGFFLHWELNF